jgi:Uma2 family endonuclease
VEFIQPGCEEYTYAVKEPIYQAAGVPELWIVDAAQCQMELWRLVDGAYQRQTTDAAGRFHLVDAGKDLTSTETALLNAGYVEL